MIHRFRVQNFKSLIDVDVELSPVTVLVGNSGTGKSNFVQAIRFLRDLLTTRNLSELVPEWMECRPAVPRGKVTQYEIEFSIQGVEDRFRYELSLKTEAADFSPLVERLFFGEQCLFHQESKAEQNRSPQPMWIVEPELRQPPNPGSIIIGKIPAIHEVVIAYTALTSGMGCYFFSDQVLRNGEHKQATDGLNDTATNYLQSLKKIVLDLQDLKVRKNMIRLLQRVNPSVSSVELDDIGQPKTVVVGHRLDGGILTLPLSQESAGFRRFYAHLLALYQRPPKQTLLFEHPEDGIHPGALSLLAEEFKAAPEQGRGQVILTTHSPALLNNFEAEQIRVVELDDFQTRIGFISQEQKEAIHDDLLDPGELLTVDPARIHKEVAPA